MTKKTSTKVLVVGDWVVDENWILAKHDSETSAHVGKLHFRSLLDQVDSQILSLCGAGNVARSLHGLSDSERIDHDNNLAKLQIYGLGLWHHNDTKLLASLFSNITISNQTPLTLSGMIPQADSKSKKLSLCGRPLKNSVCTNDNRYCLPEPYPCQYLRTLNGLKQQGSFGTTRVVRLFKTSSKGIPEQLERIDWQTPFQLTLNEKEIKRIKKNVLWKDKEPDKEPFKAIVVHDFNKGCMSTELVDLLADTYPEAKWFVRTKNASAKWINSIPEDKFALLLIGADYVPQQSKTKRWYYGDEPSKEACEELMALSKVTHQTSRLIVAVHNNNKILALNIERKRKITGYSLTGTMAPEPINIGRSSIIFASCVASLLKCYHDNSEKAMLIRANGHANKWTKSYTDRIRNAHFHEKTSPVYPLWGDFSQAINIEEYPTNIPKPCAQQFDCNDLLESWQEQSFKIYGIAKIKDGTRDKQVFHLWRGYSCIGSYIAVRSDLRERLNLLYQSIYRFRYGSIDSSLNCLIIGAPGWGKTFLSEKLAEEFSLNPLLFNVAQLTSLDQVIDCFDAISSLQNQQKNRPVLAFFDEIDSPIDGQYVFPLFLAPILDGTYRRGGRVFPLSPCVWIFAGAKNPPDISGAQKTADFMSRINGPIVRLDAEGSDTAETMTEQVYIGVSLLQQIFPDVSKIHTNVLKFFYTLKFRHGIRSLQQAIKKFRNIQYGEVRQANLPDHDQIESLVNIDKVNYNRLRNPPDSSELIEIRKEPISGLLIE